MEKYLTIKDVAKMLQISEPSAYALAQKGDLPGFKIGRGWRFRADDIRKFFEDELKDAVVEVEEEEENIPAPPALFIAKDLWETAIFFTSGFELYDIAKAPGGYAEFRFIDHINIRPTLFLHYSGKLQVESRRLVDNFFKAKNLLREALGSTPAQFHKESQGWTR